MIQNFQFSGSGDTATVSPVYRVARFKSKIFFYKNLDHYQKNASNTYSLKMSSSAKNIGFRREIRFYRLFFSVLGVDTFNSENFYSQNGTFPSPPPLTLIQNPLFLEQI